MIRLPQVKCTFVLLLLCHSGREVARALGTTLPLVPAALPYGARCCGGLLVPRPLLPAKLYLLVFVCFVPAIAVNS